MVRLNNVNLNLNTENFTNDQINAIKKLEEFYHSNELVFTLQGAAGTGKTYLLKYFLNNIVNKNVCVTAPTHKAVRVIEEMTGKKGRTLHSLHGFRLNINLENFDINNTIFDPIADPSFNNYNLVICDECSQINQNLHSINMTRAKQFNTKIIYIGDAYQTPPINEIISKTFLMPNKAILEEVVRQDIDNPLLNILTIVRDDIKTNNEKFIKELIKTPSNINEKGEGYIVMKKEQFESNIIEYYKSDDFSKDINYIRTTSWRNDTVKYWNEHIRNNIIDDNKLVNINDLFTGHTTIVDDYLKMKLINSEDYIVQSINEEVSDYGFKVYRVGILSFYDRIMSMVNIVDHTDKTFTKFVRIIKSLRHTAINSSASNRGRRWREYYKFKNEYLLLTNVQLGDSKKDILTKDIDYGYSLTTHKSQGSTYSNIGVDLSDIIFTKEGKLILNNKFNPNAVSVRNRLSYVALSRASKKAIILI